jgi:hypothetical protein
MSALVGTPRLHSPIWTADDRPGVEYVTSMSQERTENDRAGQFTPASSRPPRPQMSDVTPAPIGKQLRPSGAVKAARALWLLSFAAGLLAVVVAFLSRNVQIDRLRGTVEDIKPDQGAETLKAVATIVFWSSLGAVVVVIVVEALLLLLMMRRHGGARWALLVLVIIQAATGVISAALLVAPGGDGNAIFLLLTAALVLAGAALVAGALPGAGAWFRAEREARGHRPH